MSEAGKRLIDAAKEERAFAENFRKEQEMLDKRFIHHTRPKGPLSLDEARALHERVEKAGKKDDEL